MEFHYVISHGHNKGTQTGIVICKVTIYNKKKKKRCIFIYNQ